MSDLRIRAVVFEDRGWWVAQCLEHDLCTASKRRDDLPRQLVSQLRAQIAADRRRQRSPFETLPQAPEKFWKMYESAAADRFEVPVQPWWSRFLGKLRNQPPLRAVLALAAS
jgi:hypothetical protein